jgi:hypothetical protein
VVFPEEAALLTDVLPVVALFPAAPELTAALVEERPEEGVLSWVFEVLARNGVIA